MRALVRSLSQAGALPNSQPPTPDQRSLPVIPVSGVDASETPASKDVAQLIMRQTSSIIRGRQLRRLRAWPWVHSTSHCCAWESLSRELANRHQAELRLAAKSVHCRGSLREPLRLRRSLPTGSILRPFRDIGRLCARCAPLPR